MRLQSAVSRPARLVVTVAVVLALVGGTAAPASAETTTALDGAVLPRILVTPETTTLTTASSGTTDPTDPVFTVASGGAARSMLAVDTSGLPSDASVLGSRLEIVSAVTPDGGAVHAAVADAKPARLWGPSEPASRVLEAGPENIALDWSFTVPGDYELSIRATVSYSLPGQPTVTAEAAETRYRFQVAAEPAPAGPREDPADDASAATPESDSSNATGEPAPPPAPPAAPVSAPVSAPEVTVLEAGTVNVSNQWAVDNLLLRLVGGDGASFDPAGVVLSVPESEPWPGTGLDAGSSEYRNWDLLIPSHGPVWRTQGQADSGAANKLLLRTDAHGVSADRGSELFMSVADALVPDGGAFTTFRTDGGQPYRRWHSGQLGAASARVTLQPDANAPGEAEPLGFAFTAPGRYCVTVDSEMLDAKTGQIAHDQAALTFAVGLDVATVEPCPQPAATAPYDPAPTPTTDEGTSVIDAGLVHLSPKPTDDGSIALDLNRVAGGRTTSYTPAATVFSVPTRDEAWPASNMDEVHRQLWSKVAAPGTRLWRTAGAMTYAPVTDPRLPLALAPWADDTNAEELVDGAYTLKLVASETPDGGYTASYETDSDDRIASGSVAAQWDSRPDGRNDSIGAPGVDGGYSPFATPYSALGLAFTAPGRYCMTVESRGTFTGSTVPTIGYSTLTFAVGVDPSAITPCAQGTGGDGSTDPREDLYKDLDPTVTWFHKGHLDIGPVFVDGTLQLHTGSVHNPAEFPSVRDSVWVGRGRDIAFTVPENRPDGPDYSLIGAPGTPYYGLSADPAFIDSTPWVGLTVEGLPLQPWRDRKTAWTLVGYSGPEGGAFAMPAYRVSSANLPATFEGPNSHQHLDWAFTKEGVYCLNFEIRARDTSTGADAVVRDQLTVAIGNSVDLHTVQPCARTNPDGPAVPRAPIDPHTIDANPYVVGADDRIAFTPFISDGQLDVATERLGRPAARSRHDPEALVIGGFADNGDAWRNRSSRFLQSGLSIPAGTTQGDLSVRVGEVDGPGAISYEYYRANSYRDSSFGTRDGQSRSYALWPQFLGDNTPVFQAPGIYCVPITWSATMTTGNTVSTTKTLTYAVGVPTDTVTPCARGGSGTDPGGPDPVDPGPVVWDVPNGALTDSGATILNRGHVDVASVLSGESLDTRIKDTTVSDEPVWRDPAKTVLQVAPSAKATVPDLPEFAFLGAAGSASWILPETQDDRLLWPGWSTESIADTATRDAFRWTLTDAAGPGEFALFQSGITGKPKLLFNTRDGVTAADTTTVPKHTHAHGSWAFSAEGVYCLAFERATTLSSGQAVTDAFTLAVAVGRVEVKSVDPGQCFTEAPGKPATVDSTPTPVDQLTDAAAGSVQVLGGENGFTAGQLVTVQLGKAYAGRWVSPWFYSSPTWLGWSQVGSSGAIQVRLPADAALGAHQIAVKEQAGGLIGWDGLSVVAAPRTPPGPTPTPPDQTSPRNVAATQCVAGATILSSGHVDYASRIVDGKLESLVGDDSSGTKVYREPDGVILWLKPSSGITLPSGYGAVGPAGSSVWQVPQTQNPELIWLGWNSEALNAGNARSEVSWTLNSVNGPGSVKVYQSGVFGGVQSMMLNGGGSSYSIPLGVHAHANWAFSAEGIYRLEMTQTLTLANGQRSSDTETLTIAVGNVDPASAARSGSGCGTVSNAVLRDGDRAAPLQAAEQAAAEAADAARKVLPGQSTTRDTGFTDPFTALSQGDPVPLLLSILGMLLLAGAAGAGVLWWRRRPREVGLDREVRS
ncbi:TIGR03773 family transporter-associated surface protein [Luethyella okanaganae]|uniref:TIGR03773 family transporter-associated surface protein n=1 Tax=Luethyella okanaganae TaxID=69372 RepID=A0ABW1VG84_9MICO